MTKAVVDSLADKAMKDVYICDVEFGIKGVNYTFMTLEAMTDPGFMTEFLTEQESRRKRLRALTSISG